MVTLTIKELEEIVVARISALDASQHNQGAQVASWHESREPLTASETTTGYTHLAFSATVESAVFADDGSGEQNTTVTTECDLLVVFMYKIPAGDQVAASRNASEAARSIVSSLLKGFREAVVFPRQLFKPGPINNGWMPVETRFFVQIDVPI